MRFIEKQFPAPDMGQMPPMKPIPRWVSYASVKRKMDNQLPTLRKAMGGNSRDITTRAILMQDHIIDGFKDKIKVRRYWPEGGHGPRKLQLFLHGGGWFGGTLWAVEEYCKGLSDRADCMVLSAEYHLAPEHPFPEGLMDCHKALEWTWDRADQIGADQENFSISGDSAGGNYAAAISIMARDEGRIKLKSQVLLYPCVDMTPSGMASPLGKGMLATSRAMTEWYLKDFTDTSDPRVSPIRASSLKDLPKAMVAVCEFDGLKDQGVAYAQALSDAGVDVTCILYRNTPHAFIDDTGVKPQGLDLIREVVKFIE